MFNKNDPLISAVQEVMKRNHAEREAAKVVNEKFGVYDRKALPHEKQGEWNAAFKSVLNESDDMGPVKKKDNESVEYEHKTSGKRSKFTKHPGDNWKVVKKELKGNQHRIDVASSTGEKKPDGKLTKHDFEHLRSMKEDNEGFNNRHGLSKNVSAEKQAVAVLNEDDIDSYENRMTAGLGQQYTPYGGGRFGGGAAKTGTLARRPVRIDPGLRNINTRTGEQIKTSSGPKTRKRVVSKKKLPQQQPAQQQGPAKPPSGTFLDNLARGRRNVGTDRPAAPSLAAGAARRPSGVSTVPKIRQTGSSAGSNLPSGPWGNIRRGGASPRPTGLAAGAARRPAGQSAPPIPPGGQKSLINRVLDTKVSKTTGQRISRGLTGIGAGLAAGGVAYTSGQFSNNSPSPAAAKPKKPIQDRVPQEQPDAKKTGPENIKTTTQTTAQSGKVTDRDIMNDPRYKTAVKKVGGEKGARNISVGKTVDPVGKFSKGETIWSKVKGQLEKERSQTQTSTTVTGGQGIAGVPGGSASKPVAKPTPTSSVSGGSGDYRVAAKPAPSSPMASQGSSGATQSKILPQRPATSQSMSQNAAIGSMAPREGQQGMTVTQRRDSNYNAGVRGK